MADGGVNIDVGLNISKAEKDLQKLKDKIRKAEDDLNSNVARKSDIEKQMDSAEHATRRAKEALEKLREEYNGTRRSGRAELKPRLDSAMANYRASLKNAEDLDKEYWKVNEAIQKGTKNLADMTEQAGDMERALAAARPGAALANSLDLAKKKMMTFLKYALGIRSLFFLFRRLKSYIADAVGAFAERDAETKNNINALKASLATLKASWGAAFASILNAVAPILQKLIGWLTTAANAINMFFSALQGKTTYKKAVANMDSVASSAGGAADAVEEAKKQLMGFDEINRLDDTRGPSGGGGGGGGLAEAEEELINPKMIAFVEWLKDHLEEIAVLAGTIGALLLAWKLSKNLGLEFKDVLGVIMIIYGAALLVKGAIDAWQNGIDWDNLRLMLGGIAVAAIGAAIAFGAVGAAIALLIGGVVLLVLGFREWIQAGELSAETLTAIVIGIGLVAAAIALLTKNGPLGLLIAGIGLLVVGIMDWIKTGELSQRTFQILANGILLVGAAISLMTHSWLPLLIAGFVILVLAIVKNWDTIKEKTIEIWTSITDWLKETWQSIKDKALEYFGPLYEDIKLIWDGIKEIFQGLVDFVAGVFTGDWDRAWSGVESIFTGVVEVISGAIGGLFDLFSGLIQACADVLSWLQGVFDGINTVANQNAEFNERTGNLYATDPSQLRGYASGGVVDRATALIAGENGKEAIVPLERNTQWMSMVADGLMDRFTQSSFINDLASAFASVPLPAMAGGGVVPPRAMGDSSALSEGDLSRLAAAISGALSGGQDGNIKIGVYLDGRELSDVVTKWQRRNNRGVGI